MMKPLTRPGDSGRSSLADSSSPARGQVTARTTPGEHQDGGRNPAGVADRPDRLSRTQTFGPRPVCCTVENKHRSTPEGSDRVIADVIDRIDRIERRLDAIDAW